MNSGLEIHVPIFSNCSSIKRFKVKPQVLSVPIGIYCGLFFVGVGFTSLFFLSLDYYHRRYPLSMHLHGYPLQTFSIS